MAHVTVKSIAGLKYIAGPADQKIWVVYKQWPGGRVDRVAGYFTESLARAHVGALAGTDGLALCGLEVIDVLDVPGGKSNVDT